MLNEYDRSDPKQERPAAPSPYEPTIPSESPAPGGGARPPAPPLVVRQPIHPDAMARLGIALGIAMILIAILWVNILTGDDIWALLQPADIWLLLPGLAIGAAFALVIWTAGRRTTASREIVRMLSQTLNLNAVRFWHVLLFSLTAAIPEEILFRGAVQMQIGLVLASIVFGVLHALTRAYFLYATLAGLMLGALLIISGSLWLPIGAHFAVDLVMFMLLLRRQPRSLDRSDS